MKMRQVRTKRLEPPTAAVPVGRMIGSKLGEWPAFGPRAQPMQGAGQCTLPPKSSQADCYIAARLILGPR